MATLKFSIQFNIPYNFRKNCKYIFIWMGTQFQYLLYHNTVDKFNYYYIILNYNSVFKYNINIKLWKLLIEMGDLK